MGMCGNQPRVHCSVQRDSALQGWSVAFRRVIWRSLASVAAGRVNYRRPRAGRRAGGALANDIVAPLLTRAASVTVGRV